jgi:hypothetical protein
MNMGNGSADAGVVPVFVWHTPGALNVSAHSLTGPRRELSKAEVFTLGSSFVAGAIDRNANVSPYRMHRLFFFCSKTKKTWQVAKKV